MEMLLGATTAKIVGWKSNTEIRITTETTIRTINTKPKTTATRIKAQIGAIMAMIARGGVILKRDNRIGMIPTGANEIPALTR